MDTEQPAQPPRKSSTSSGPSCRAITSREKRGAIKRARLEKPKKPGRRERRSTFIALRWLCRQHGLNFVSYDIIDGQAQTWGCLNFPYGRDRVFGVDLITAGHAAVDALVAQSLAGAMALLDPDALEKENDSSKWIYRKRGRLTYLEFPEPPVHSALGGLTVHGWRAQWLAERLARWDMPDIMCFVRVNGDDVHAVIDEPEIDNDVARRFVDGFSGEQAAVAADLEIHRLVIAGRLAWEIACHRSIDARARGIADPAVVRPEPGAERYFNNGSIAVLPGV